MTTVEREPASRLFRDYGGAILVAVVIAMAIRLFVLEAYRIPSSAMRPALEPGDTIFVFKSAYGLGRPRVLPARGDVIVFAGPEDPDRDFVKRVVALPGETAELRKGRLWINGKEVSGVPAAHSACGREQDLYEVCWEPPLLGDLPSVKVPEGSVYVLGDLRSRTTDVRLARAPVGGLVPISLIRGKALWVWLSIEPAPRAPESGWFSRIRFERMFRRIP